MLLNNIYTFLKIYPLLYFLNIQIHIIIRIILKMITNYLYVIPIITFYTKN